MQNRMPSVALAASPPCGDGVGSAQEAKVKATPTNVAATTTAGASSGASSENAIKAEPPPVTRR